MVRTYTLWAVQEIYFVESGGVPVVGRIHGPRLFYDDMVATKMGLEVEEMLNGGLPGFLVYNTPLDVPNREKL